FERVDELFVFGGAKGGNDQSLGFATGKDGRTVGAGQDADFRQDRADGLEVTAVDTAAGIENVPANDLGLKIVDDFAQLFLGQFAGFDLGGKCLLDLGIGRVDRGVALGLFGDLIGSAQVGFG